MDCCSLWQCHNAISEYCNLQQHLRITKLKQLVLHGGRLCCQDTLCISLSQQNLHANTLKRNLKKKSNKNKANNMLVKFHSCKAQPYKYKHTVLYLHILDYLNSRQACTTSCRHDNKTTQTIHVKVCNFYLLLCDIAILKNI